MIRVVEYLDERGHSPFGRWFDGLTAQAAAKVSTAVERMRQGNLASTKSVGGGVREYRIDWGPGYRIYFAQDGNTLILLLGGGTKKRQDKDIRQAQERWASYRSRKRSR
jgi:putative addiction module killer protein